MNKSPVAIIVALIAAATMFASGAQAGFKIRLGFGGPLPAFTAHGGNYHSERHYHRKRYLARRVVKKEKVYVAKRKTTSEPKKVIAKTVTKKPEAVATAPVTAPEVIADNENSSISTASLDTAVVDPALVKEGEVPAVEPAKVSAATEPVQAAKPKTTQAASKLDCKKFFPSVGMTLTVPCE
jgi:hypothetical protein